MESNLQNRLNVQKWVQLMKQRWVIPFAFCLFLNLLACIGAWYEIWVVNESNTDYDWSTKDGILFIFLAMCCIGLFIIINCCQICFLPKKRKKHLKLPAQISCSAAFLFYFIGIILCFVNFNTLWDMEHLDSTWAVFVDILLVIFIIQACCFGCVVVGQMPMIGGYFLAKKEMTQNNQLMENYKLYDIKTSTDSQQPKIK